MRLKLTATERGFAVAEFDDLYGKRCSIQKSSLATDDAIWLGCESGTHVDGKCLARMHLSRELAAALLPVMERFVRTGEIEPGSRRRSRARSAGVASRREAGGLRCTSRRSR